MDTHPHFQRAYERVLNFDEVAPNARLRYLDWKIVFALDGQKTGADIALAFGLSESRLIEIFDRILGSGVVAEVELTLEQFRARLEKEAPTAPPPPSPAEVVATSHAEGSQVESTNRNSSSVASLSASISRRTPAHNGTDVQAGNLDSSATSVNGEGAISLSLKKRFRLKSAIDFIQVHAGGGTLGQLAVYRVMMQVPTELLREAGVQRLDFNNDSTEVENPKLRQAIVDAISKMLKVDLSISYFLE